MIKPDWPDNKIKALLNLRACIWQGKIKIVTPDEAYRIICQMRNELTAYYEQRIKDLEQSHDGQ